MRRTVRELRREFRGMVGREPRLRVQLDRPVRRYGSEYGGWCVCPTCIDSNSIVYSFGVGEDVSFDLALIEAFGVTVHAFDPTPRSIEWVAKQQMPPQFKMHPYGIASVDGVVPFFPPDNPEHISHTILDRASGRDQAIMVSVFRLATIMNELGHASVDVVKMDIEGAEYEVIEDIVETRACVRQILVEFHHRFHKVGSRRTMKAIRLLNLSGYRIFAISQNDNEYSFLRD